VGRIWNEEQLSENSKQDVMTNVFIHTIKIRVSQTRELTEILFHSKANRSEEAARMLERCVRLDAAYIPAYLLLARLYEGQEGCDPAVGRLLRHVAHLQPNSPDHLAELAAWLHQKGTYCHRGFSFLYSV
jgi:Tfp pilus assembly protein PilF